jgi:hypothetical protein
MNDVIMNASFYIGWSESVPITNVNLNTLFMSGAVTQLNLSDQDLANLASELKKSGFLTGYITRSVYDKPVYCEVFIEMNITAKV